MTILLADVSSLIERPKNFADITSHEGFLAPLDHTQHALKSVLSDYHLQIKAHCGLKGCGQLHNHGFLVMTESGAVTNIGQDCGKTHFGDGVFQSARADHTRLRERADLLRKAKEIQEATPTFVASIKDFAWTRKYGAKWAAKAKNELTTLIGQGLIGSLEALQQRGDFEVKNYRQRTEDEIDDLVAATRGLSRAAAKDATEAIGTLEPMPWITFDFKKRLMTDLMDPMQRFQNIDALQMSQIKLKAALKPFDGYSGVLEEAEEAAATVLRFLKVDNLKLLILWIPEHHKDQRNALRSWIGKEKHSALLAGSV